MSRCTSILPWACALVLPLALGGCVGALVVGGMAAAGDVGYAAAQERGLGGSVEDFTLETNVESALNKAGPTLASVTVTVYQGRVLLTGRAMGPEEKRQAGDTARGVAGVQVVYNELEVVRSETAWDAAQDAWITARLRSQLILDPAIRSGNYNIDTVNRSVYLIGSARTETELRHATQVARFVPGVKRVVSYVEIRPGAPVAAQSAPGLPAGAEPSAPAAAPGAPNGPIEVQKL